MAQKQQILINFLNKYVRQYFLFDEAKKFGDKPKIRMRDEVHCVEEATSREAKEMQLEQRRLNDKMGHMNPEYLPFKPVAGWPVLRLEELVLKAMEKQLDPKIWEALKSHFEKIEVKRITETSDFDLAIKDLSVVFKFSTSGYNLLRAHLAETECRMAQVKAGTDYQQHLTRTIKARRHASKREWIQKISADPDVVVAKERVRRDTISFVKWVKYILDTLQLIRVRHLKSHTPISLQTLATEKDRESARSDRPLQTASGPNAYSFKDQIIDEAPPDWPLKSKYAKKSFRIELPTIQVADVNGKRSGKKMAESSVNIYGGDNGSSYEEFPSPGDTQEMASKASTDTEFSDRFRTRWPPVWMSLAAMEQGYTIVDPQCPTREQALNPDTLNEPKSMTRILATRDSWASAREALETSVAETLWREDKERPNFSRLQFASLSEVPIAKPYATYLKHANQLLAKTRADRQTKTIFDCELTKWYKYLVIKVHEEVGQVDDEVNQLLQMVKFHFKMSPTSLRFGKAKMALLTLSLPAYELTQIPVQRALRFVVCHVLEAPESMLIGWLATRGLPFVLLSSHAI